MWWQAQDRKVLKRVNRLIVGVSRNGNIGIDFSFAEIYFPTFSIIFAMSGSRKSTIFSVSGMVSRVNR